MAVLVTAPTPFHLPPEAAIFGRSEAMGAVCSKVEELAASIASMKAAPSGKSGQTLAGEFGKDSVVLT